MHVLVLNRNFYAVAVAPWQRALALLYGSRAVVVDEAWRTYGFEDWVDLSGSLEEHLPGFIHTPNLRIAIPQAIALRMYGKVPSRDVPFSRRNVYQHYGYRCCYCGRRLPGDELNLDHVLPRSRGGDTSWENVVTSCIPCNKKKGSRLPSEAGMRLQVHPSRPRPEPGAVLWSRFPAGLREVWKKYL